MFPFVCFALYRIITEYFLVLTWLKQLFFSMFYVFIFYINSAGSPPALSIILCRQSRNRLYVSFFFNCFSCLCCRRLFFDLNNIETHQRIKIVLNSFLWPSKKTNFNVEWCLFEVLSKSNHFYRVILLFFIPWGDKQRILWEVKQVEVQQESIFSVKLDLKWFDKVINIS